MPSSNFISFQTDTLEFASARVDYNRYKVCASAKTPKNSIKHHKG